MKKGEGRSIYNVYEISGRYKRISETAWYKKTVTVLSILFINYFDILIIKKCIYKLFSDLPHRTTAVVTIVPNVLYRLRRSRRTGAPKRHPLDRCAEGCRSVPRILADGTSRGQPSDAASRDRTRGWKYAKSSSNGRAREHIFEFLEFKCKMWFDCEKFWTESRLVDCVLLLSVLGRMIFEIS